MKTRIYAIYDKEAKAYGQPFFAPTDVHAIRSLAVEVNSDSKNSFMAVWPEYFELYNVGEFDDETGTVSATERKMISTAVSLKKKDAR